MERKNQLNVVNRVELNLNLEAFICWCHAYTNAHKQQNCSCNFICMITKIYYLCHNAHCFHNQPVSSVCADIRYPIVYFVDSFILSEFTRQIIIVLILKSSIVKSMHYLFSLHFRCHKSHHMKPMMLPTAQHQVNKLFIRG